MPESESSGGGEPRAAEGETRNLPVPVPPSQTQPVNGSGEGWLQRALRLLFRWKSNSIRADLASLLEGASSAESGLSPEESAMLRNILALRERRVEDVMVPRADIVAVHQTIPLGELMRLFESAGHSRLVVYNDTLDDPVGMVHIRDLIAFMTKQATVPPSDKPRRRRPLPAGLDLKAIDLALPLVQARIIRPILFVPPSMPAMDLLAKMQAERMHLALVIDEYGGTDGLVSIEDIVELIVGDIADEHDVEEPADVTPQGDGSFIADARADLEEVVAAIGPDFDVREHLDEVDTIGGYLVTRAGHVPVRGELVAGPPGFEIEVLDADPRRVKRVRIYRSANRRAARLRRREEPASAKAEAAPDFKHRPGPREP